MSVSRPSVTPFFGHPEMLSPASVTQNPDGHMVSSQSFLHTDAEGRATKLEYTAVQHNSSTAFILRLDLPLSSPLQIPEAHVRHYDVTRNTMTSLYVTRKIP